MNRINYIVMAIIITIYLAAVIFSAYNIGYINGYNSASKDFLEIVDKIIKGTIR